MDKRHLFTKCARQIRHNVRFKKYSTNFYARKCIWHIRANEVLAPSSLVSQICAHVFWHSALGSYLTISSHKRFIIVKTEIILKNHT
jgi:hypothetical protein